MYKVKINYNRFNISLSVNLTDKNFFDEVSNEDVVKFLKGIFTNRERFINRFIDSCKGVKSTMEEQRDSNQLDKYDHVDPEDFECEDFMNELIDMYDVAKPFTYAEAFNIKNQQFQIQVFESIDIVEMIQELGHERIKTEGMPVKHKQFNHEGEFTGYKEYDNIYEVHKVSGEELGLEEDLYALKCWCTTTNKEHWLWIEDQYKDSPLEAVASTFRIHENLIPHIKELKRQGDVLLVEMKKEVEPEGDIVPLNAKQYFSLLTAQS